MATEPKPEIHEAMAAILDEMPAVGKDSQNQGQGFSFRGIDAIVNALNPLLGKHGVVPVLHRCELLRWEPRTKGYAAVVLNTYRLTARDGSWIETQGLGEGADTFDKAVSKANTMAQKVMLGQTFCLATEDDPDEENPDTGSQPEPTETKDGAAPEPWEATKAKVDAFLKQGTPGYDGRREQLLAQMAKQGLPTTLDKATEEQLKDTETLVAGLTEPF